MQHIKLWLLSPTVCDMTPQLLIKASNPAPMFSSAYGNPVSSASQPKTFAISKVTNAQIDAVERTLIRAPLVCVSDDMELLAVWRHNKPKTKKTQNPLPATHTALLHLPTHHND